MSRLRVSAIESVPRPDLPWFDAATGRGVHSAAVLRYVRLGFDRPAVLGDAPPDFVAVPVAFARDALGYVLAELAAEPGGPSAPPRVQ